MRRVDVLQCPSPLDRAGFQPDLKSLVKYRDPEGIGTL